MFTTLFVSLLATLPSVLAHGYVSQVSIDGKAYAGNVPNNYKGPSPIRLIDDIGPVKGASNVDLMCGLSAQKAEMVVPANPGSTVTFQWVGGGGNNWPHQIGPLMTYLASCGSTACDQFDPTGAKWFKIDQVGQDSNGKWYQNAISTGASFDLTLPQNLSPGGYLIRHEIIALHLGDSLGGAEFYPSCTQIQVGGNGNGQPSPTVSFPGAYSDTDPGIWDKNIFNPGQDNYTFPGGPLSNLASSSDSLGAPASGSVSFPSGTAASPAPSGASGSTTTGGNGAPAPSAPAGGSQSSDDDSQTGGSCQLKRSASSDNVNRPRHYSRIMKRIMHHATAAVTF